MINDFPAAHSMDTDWFATDRHGHVGVFSTGEAGHLPVQWVEKTSGLWSPSKTSILDILAPLLRLSEEEKDLFWDEHDDPETIALDAGLYVYEYYFSLEHLLSLFTGREVPESDPNLIGIYYAIRVPTAPIHLDQLPPAARKLCRRVHFNDIDFAAAPAVQPIEHVECRFYDGEGIAYLAGNGRTVHCVPGHEAEFRTFHKEFRKKFPRAAAKYRFEDPVPPRSEIVSALPGLIQGLKDADPKVRRRSVGVLAALGSRAKKAVPALIQRLTDKVAQIRGDAARALGALGAAAKEATPALVPALKDTAADVRIGASWALGRIQPDFASATSVWIDALSDEHPLVRQNAAWALEKIGAEASAAVPALIQALSDEETDVRRAAARALHSIGPAAKPAVRALIRALGDEDNWVAADAAFALGSIGAPARAAVPALIQILESTAETADADTDYRCQAAECALRDIGPEAKPAVPALIKALTDKNEEVRGLAALALASIDPAAAKASMPVLIKLLDYSDVDFVRGEAAEALGKIGPGAKAAVPALLKTLSDKSAEVRRQAVAALGDIGPAAKKAIAALKPLLSGSDDKELSRLVGEALGKIQSTKPAS